MADLRQGTAGDNSDKVLTLDANGEVRDGHNSPLSKPLATVEQLNDKASLSGVIANVKWFGANGDGNDDTEAIKSARDSLPDGGTLYIPPTLNSYGVTEEILFNDKINIVGAGILSQIKLIPADTQLGKTSGVFRINADNCKVKGIHINGNSDAGGDNRNSGLYISAGTKNCQVEDFYGQKTSRHGLCFLGTGHTFKNIYIWDTLRHNISGGSGDNVTNATFNCVLENLFLDGGQAGLELNDGVHGITVDGFHITGERTDAPIHIKTHSREGESNSDIFIKNGIIDNPTVYDASTEYGSMGIAITTYIDAENELGYVLDCNNVHVDNVDITCKYHGIRVEGEIDGVYFNKISIDTEDAAWRVVGNTGVGSSIKDVHFNKIKIKGAGAGITMSGNADEKLMHSSISNVEVEDAVFGNSNSIISLSNVEEFECENADLSFATLQSQSVLRVTDSSGVTLRNVRGTKGGNGIEILDSDVKIIDGRAIENEFGLVGLRSTIELRGGKYNNNERHGARFDACDVKIDGGEYARNNQAETIGYGIVYATDDEEMRLFIVRGALCYDDQATVTQTSAVNYSLGSGSLKTAIITGNELRDGISGVADLPASAIVDNNITDAN